MKRYVKKIILLIIEKIRKALKVDEKGNSFGWGKGTLLLAALMMVGCGDNMAIEGLDIVNGTKYVVISKSKKPKKFTYSLIKVGGMDWYDYSYSDTTDFNIGDTLVIIVAFVRSAEKSN